MRWRVKPGMFGNVSFRVSVGGKGHVCSNEGNTCLTSVGSQSIFCDSMWESFSLFKNTGVHNRF